MGVEVPERLQDEVLEVVAEATPGETIPHGTVCPPEKIEEGVRKAKLLWAERGNPVSDEIDNMLEKAVTTALTGWDPKDD